MISIVVTWRNRIELGRALPSLEKAAAVVGGEIIIVRHGGERELLLRLLRDRTRPLRIVHRETTGYFNKSEAQNWGAAAARHSIIFFCDCDIILSDSTLPEIYREISADPETFCTLAAVRETELNSRGGNHVVSFGYELRITTSDGRRLKIEDNEEDARDGTRQAPGLLVVRKPHFLSIKGYNGRLHGWGWEDQDMIARLTLGAGLRRQSLGAALHISHGDAARVASYPETDRWSSRDRMFRQALANYDQRDFQGTFEEDTRDQTQIDVQELDL